MQKGFTAAPNSGKKSAVDYRSEETYAATRLPVELASTLIPDAYRDPNFYEVEQQRVWAGGWVCVGYTSQISEPGDMFCTTVAGQPIFVTRDRDQQVRAFYNVCRHRGSQLIAGDCHQDVIRCPYHNWGYALDGTLLGTPYFKGLDAISEEEKAVFDTSEAKGFCKEDYPLLPVAVDTWGCFVFINLNPEHDSLSTWLGDLPQRVGRHPLSELQLVRRIPLRIHANWKLIAENFMEYYHLPWVHPELCSISGFRDHYRYQGPGMYTGMATAPLSQSPSTCSFDLPTMPNLHGLEAQSAFWYLIFPNIALFLLPNHLFTLLLLPDGVGNTIESADMLVHPNALTAPNAQSEINKILDFWSMVNRQDIQAVERVQKGLQSTAYPGGRMCYRFEEPVHRYQNMVIDLMIDNHRIPSGDPEEEQIFVAAGLPYGLKKESTSNSENATADDHPELHTEQQVETEEWVGLDNFYQPDEWSGCTDSADNKDSSDSAHDAENTDEWAGVDYLNFAEAWSQEDDTAAEPVIQTPPPSIAKSSMEKWVGKSAKRSSKELEPEAESSDQDQDESGQMPIVQQQIDPDSQEQTKSDEVYDSAAQTSPQNEPASDHSEQPLSTTTSQQAAPAKPSRRQLYLSWLEGEAQDEEQDETSDNSVNQPSASARNENGSDNDASASTASDAPQEVRHENSDDAPTTPTTNETMLANHHTTENDSSDDDDDDDDRAVATSFDERDEDDADHEDRNAHPAGEGDALVHDHQLSLDNDRYDDTSDDEQSKEHQFHGDHEATLQTVAGPGSSSGDEEHDS